MNIICRLHIESTFDTFLYFINEIYGIQKWLGLMRVYENRKRIYAYTITVQVIPSCHIFITRIFKHHLLYL